MSSIGKRLKSRIVGGIAVPPEPYIAGGLVLGVTSGRRTEWRARWAASAAHPRWDSSSIWETYVPAHPVLTRLNVQPVTTPLTLLGRASVAERIHRRSPHCPRVTHRARPAREAIPGSARRNTKFAGGGRFPPARSAKKMPYLPTRSIGRPPGDIRNPPAIRTSIPRMLGSFLVAFP